MGPIEFDRRKQKTRILENRFTPIEIAKILKDGDYEKLPFFLRPLLEAGEPPVGYVRESWSEAFDYYTAHRGARRLIIIFCEPGVPTGYFLQMLRDDLYDVVVVYDRRKLFFDRGIPGFSDSFFETLRLIEAFVKAKGFHEVVTFGVSMGGYPALRAGLLICADRAISIGGRYSWHVGRLLRKQETPSAFDVLCPCFLDRQVELVAVTAAQKPNDVKDLETLRRTFPSCHAVMVDTEVHNVIGYLHKVKLLRLFCACLFEYWHNDNRDELMMLVNRTAHQVHAVRLGMRQELDRVYGSTSWRLTRPLRGIAKASSQWNWLRGILGKRVAIGGMRRRVAQTRASDRSVSPTERLNDANRS